MYYVYFMTNKNNRVLYVGVTNDLHRRTREHKNGKIEGFTQKYHASKLVYYEEFCEIAKAIAREKQLKKWIRAKKNQLVESINPEWKDLETDDFSSV